jgi:3-hydroxyisobutyrate dehydrogenase-like beta-hydroxyacid dehydrogenase
MGADGDEPPSSGISANRLESNGHKAADLISAGARLAKSPAEAVRDAEAVVLMLENGAIVTELFCLP